MWEKAPKGIAVVMPGLAVLLIIFLATGAVLLVCLRGFSQARRHQKVQGLLVRVEATSPGPPSRTGGKGFDFAAHRARASHATPTENQISKKTVALIGLAILPGSRGGAVEQFPAPVAPGRDCNAQAGKHPHVPGKQLLRGS
jgi:hypothetical protein